MNRRSFLRAFSFLAVAPAVAAEIIATRDPQRKMELWRDHSSAEFRDINAYFADHRSLFQKAIYDHIWKTNPFSSLVSGATFPYNAG